MTRAVATRRGVRRCPCGPSADGSSAARRSRPARPVARPRRTSARPATTGRAAGCRRDAERSIARRTVRRAGTASGCATPRAAAALPAVAGRLLRPGEPLDGLRSRARRLSRTVDSSATSSPAVWRGVLAGCRRTPRSRALAVSSSQSAPAVPSATRRRRCSARTTGRRAQERGHQQRQRRRRPAAAPARPRPARSGRRRRDGLAGAVRPRCRGRSSRRRGSGRPGALVRAVLGARPRRPGQVDRASGGDRRGVEGHPAEVVEVDLHPGVGVVAGDQPRAVALRRPGRVAQGDPRGHPGRPDHDRHRAGVLLAVAPLEPEEVHQVVAAGPRLGGEAVDEPVGPVGQVVVDAPDPLVGAARAGGQRRRRGRSPRVERRQAR